MLKHYIARFWARNLTTYRVLFCMPPRSKKFFPPQNVLGHWHSSLDPQFIWINPWLGWKAIYVETLYSAFLSAKFDNVSSTFFVYHLGQKLSPPQTALGQGQWHSSPDPQFIWISPWLGWKAIYVETLYSAFLSAKFDNVSSTFFVYHLGQKLSPPQTALGQRHSSLDPQFMNKSLTRLKSDLCWNTI